MTYEEIVAKAKEEFGSADVSKYEGHLALQINITGEGEGAFYAEINDGQLFIEPYEYYDNDAVLTADGNDIISLFNGTLDAKAAFEEGKLSVTGDVAKALSIQPVIEENKKTAKKTTKKAAAKKTTTTKKTTAAKKTTTTKKAAAKKEEAPAITGLAEPKKAPAKATAPKAAAKKTTTKTTKASTKAAKTATKTTAKKG